MYDNTTLPPFNISPVDSDLQNQSLGSSAQTSPFMVDGPNFQMDDIQANFGPNFGTGNDFRLFDGEEDLYNARVQIPHQLPTPDPSIFRRCHDTYIPSAPSNAEPIPHISPIGHGNTMLYTPSLSAVDETFEIFQSDNSSLRNDFELFSNHPNMTLNHGSNSTLFGELPSSAAAFSQSATQEFFQPFYSMTTNTGTDWQHQDEGYSGFGDH